MLDTFPHFYQLDALDCGPASLQIVAKYYGKDYALQYLREHSHIDREGVSMKGIIEAAEHIGMRSLPVKLAFSGKSKDQAYLADAPLPCIVHWRQEHFLVVYKINRKYVWVSDPAGGKFKLDHETFKKYWQEDGEYGIGLLLEPTPEFYEQSPAKSRIDFLFLTTYLKPYRRYFIQLIIGLFLGSLFQLIFPFLTQAIVDIGIQNQNIGFIYLILIAQLMLFLGQMTVSVIQSWLLLHIGTRINVSLISDFLTKLMKLPIRFFDAKMTGDLLQRISDQNRIEDFLTNSTLNFLFSAFNLVIFGIVLLIYDVRIFGIFLVASILYVLWILIFLRRRKEVDYQRFQELSAHQNTLIELIQGMQEIKLQNSNRKRRRQWSNIQARLFGINLKSLAIEQYQNAGAGFISQLKDILIIFLTAKLVLDGEITLIPEGKVTAIVGASGSGKTTLVKLLLGFYPPTQGQIRVGNLPLSQIEKTWWRSQCGAVMQDGFIFSDTIANNIAESAEQVDQAKLAQSAETANIVDFIESMPLGFNTMIGARGNGISQGQRQRILIARAVYKNPEFLFLDEATNALDAKNERLIVDSLAHFFQGKTVVVVAHRLSTVKNADQIVVLDKGQLVEKGTHLELVKKKGAYFYLIKDQLELGG
ncbi:MAG: peptidase domain-containing ABC transporter [Saprospirales bacterium]|nr:peptidase domain-containing ABC transporter [Saprospirales bacterium]